MEIESGLAFPLGRNYEYIQKELIRVKSRLDAFTDVFQGIAYVDDKQIRDLRPRIIDVSEAFKKLECRTTPMDTFSLDDIPIGSLFPLAMGMRNYYVVRIIYYN